MLSVFLDFSTQNSSVFWIMIAIWALIFIATLILEFETADLTSIWFCIASVVSLICALFSTKPLYQVIVFLAISVILILATRPLTKKMMKQEIIHTNTDRLVGMIATVTKDIIEDGIGEVKVDNGLWRAVSIDGINITIGEKVIINSLSGNKVVVSKINTNNDIEYI